MEKRYRFNFRKFLNNVVAPLQFMAGLLMLFGAAGGSDLGSMGCLECIGLGILGAVLMGGAAIYQKI